MSGYRVGFNGVPGRPDIAYTKEKLAIFVQGCFWHRCSVCDPPTPKANRRFWQAKFAENKDRDTRVQSQLESLGWEVLEVWECEVASSAETMARRIQRKLAELADR